MTPRSPKLTRTGLTLSTFVLFAGSLFSQTTTTGDLTGAVKDSSGGIIPGAHVLLKSIDNGDTRTDTANDNGAYRFTTLKPGNYSVTADAGTMRSSDVRINIGVGQVAKVDITLKIPTATTIVEVTEAAPIVNSDNANSTATISSKQVIELPAAGGDLTTVAFTVPGIAISTGGGYGNFSSHGLPGVSNLFTINGNDYNDAYLNLNNSGASNLLLGQNEIAEASVTQNGYSVQFGRQAGAQVNFVTKGGTNRLHADLNFNFNNHLMNANDFFNNENGTARPYAVSRQWGADIGGPVIKDKLFFFSDAEGIYYSLPSSGYVVAPSSQLQAYMLQNLTSAQVPLYQKAFSIWNNAPGAKNAVNVTTGNGALQDASGSLGCGDFAASNTPSPDGGIFGTSTSCATAYRVNALNTNREWLETHRADWNINDKQKIYFRYKGDHGFQPTSTSLLTPTLNVQSIQPQDEGQINHFYSISPTIVNNIVASVLWYSAVFKPASVSASSNLFPTAFELGGAGASINGGGGTSLTSMGIDWNAFPQGRDVGQFQLTDDLSVIKGNHTFKFGENFRRNRVTDFTFEENQIGTYNFNSFTDFATGALASGSSDYSQRFSSLQDVHIRLYNIGFFAQDEWAVKPNLKITYGLRLDRTGNPECVDKCFTNLDVPFGSSSYVGGADVPYNKTIVTGESNAYYKVPSIIPNPRVGVVWSSSRTNGTVVRGGFGMFSDLAPAFLVSNVFSNAPSPSYTAVVYGGNVSLAGDPTSSAASAAAQYNGFHTGFANGATFTQLQASPAGFTPFTYFSTPSEFKAPTYLEWSFEIQQPIGAKNVLVATYSGNHGYNLLLANPYANAGDAGFNGLPSASPDPRFLGVTSIENLGRSNYDGLTFEYRRSLSYGLQGHISYTYSHALDNISNGGSGLPYSFCSGCGLSALPSPNVASSYGNADYDIRHNITGDLIWDLPFKFGDHKILTNLLGNWTLADKLYLRSGTPFSITDAIFGYVNGNQSFAGAPFLATTTAGSLPHSCGLSSLSTPCYTTAQFLPEFSETSFGNVGRNSIYGPHFYSTDISLFKNFTIREGMKLMVGASAYNALNHPNFQNPGADLYLSGGGFGTIGTTAVPPTSGYGAFQGSAVSGRVLVLTGRFSF